MIEKGTGRASRLGFPTINIPFEDEEISGIYAARVIIDKVSFNSAVYADKRRNLLEAHLLDFSGELYGREASIELLKKLRDDNVFDNDAALRAAIADDVRKVIEYFTV